MRTTICTLAAIIATPLLAQNPLLDQGRAALDRHDFKVAVRILEQAAAENPKSADAHYLLGNAYGRLAEHAPVWKQPELAWKTKTEFERAVQTDPNHLRSRFALIEYYLQAPMFLGGDNSKAYQQATEIRMRDAQKGHRAFAIIHIREKHFDQAREEYLAMVREAPQSAEAHYRFALFLADQRSYKAAAEEFETVVRIDPANMPAWFQIGRMAALTKQNLTRGAEALRKYLSYTPQDDDDPPHTEAQSILGTITAEIASQPGPSAGGAAHRQLSRRR